MARGPIWVFPLDKSMEVNNQTLPRPAFVADLERLSVRQPELHTLVLADSLSDSAQEQLTIWLKALGHSRRTLVTGRGITATLSELAQLHDASKMIELPGWSGGKIPRSDLLQLASVDPPPHLVLTCEPYDSYGVHIKRELEECLLPLIKQWGAIFLAHDRVYGTLRGYDARQLADRLHGRTRRLRWYRRLLKSIFWFADRLATERVRGWRTVA